MQNPRLADEELVAQMRSVRTFVPHSLSHFLRTSSVSHPHLPETNTHRNLSAPSTLIFAALDTTSGAIVRTLQLLSTHPAIQERLRSELTEAKLIKGDDDLDFDTLDGLPYLDAVCADVLRLQVIATWHEYNLDSNGPRCCNTGIHLCHLCLERTSCFLLLVRIRD